MKTTLSFILDLIFIGFVTFIISLVILSYYFIGTTALILSIVLTLLTIVIVTKRNLKKRKGLILSKEQTENLLKLTEGLSIISYQMQLKLLSKALENNGTAHTLNKNFIKIKDKKIAIVSLFSFCQITKADIVMAFNYNDPNYQTYILANYFSNEIKDCVKRFNGKIILIEKEKVYQFFSKQKVVVPSPLAPEKARLKLKSALENLLDKKKSKNFFLFGIIFLFTSYFVPIKLYYVIFGCVFLIISLLLKIFGKTPINA